MSYVDVNAPLPRNGRSPVPQCEIDAAAAQVQAVEQMAQAGRAASSQLATPASFASMGQGVQNDVARSQRELVAAQKFLHAPLKESPHQALRNSPTCVPLNVTPEEYSGCSFRTDGSLTPIVISHEQGQITMPAPAPTDTALLLPEGAFGGRGFAARRIMKGYRGMGVVWGDAIADPRAQVVQTSKLSGTSLLLLGLGALGLYAVTRKGRR